MSKPPTPPGARCRKAFTLKGLLIDETWASTNMTPRYGRCERGKRLIAHTPFGHWKTTTLLAALRYDGVTALRRSYHGARFLAYVEQMLVPTLSPGESVLFGKPSKPQVQQCAFCHLQPELRSHRAGLRPECRIWVPLQDTL
jgi:hypothetical protein